MRRVLYKAVPWVKEEATLALEAGVDGLIVPDEQAEAASRLARGTVIPASSAVFVRMSSKADEEYAAGRGADAFVVLEHGWEIIPLENLLAQTPDVAVEVVSGPEARTAGGVLERGVNTLVVPATGLGALRDIVAVAKHDLAPLRLVEAEILSVEPSGLGHRVCVDTLSRFSSGRGMLVGDSAAFTFLVNAETEHNEYVASRPFRINAGAVHAYAIMPDDRTAYLDELASGSEVLIVDHTGGCATATVGRVKVEQRPMLRIEAAVPDGPSGKVLGTVFLQNAETIRLVEPGGRPISVVDLAPGSRVLVRLDAAGRHFGMRISEDIKEG